MHAEICRENVLPNKTFLISSLDDLPFGLYIPPILHYFPFLIPKYNLLEWLSIGHGWTQVQALAIPWHASYVRLIVSSMGGSRQESLEHPCKITNNKSRQEISNANMSILFLEGKRGYILHNIKFCFQWLQPRAKKAPSSSKINHMG